MNPYYHCQAYSVNDKARHVIAVGHAAKMSVELLNSYENTLVSRP